MQNARYRKTTPARRRLALMRVRATLGDKMFADFMVDTLTESGLHIVTTDLEALAAIWLRQRASKLEIPVTPSVRPVRERKGFLVV
jgi:hypothetical protein